MAGWGASFTQAIDTLFTSTLEARKSELEDMLLKSLPLMSIITGKAEGYPGAPSGAALVPQSGGSRIFVPLSYGRGTAESFGAYHQFTAAPFETMTGAYYDWKWLGAAMQQCWVLMQKNKGSEKIFDIVNAEVEGTVEALKEKLSALLWTSTTPGADDITGLPYLLTADGTGTIGGIVAGTYTHWKNQFKTSSGPADLYLWQDWSHLMNDCWQYRAASNGVTVIVTTQAIWEAYEQIAADRSYLDRVNGTVDFGFNSIRFRGANVIWDADCPAGYAYFINPKYLQFYYDPQNWFKQTEWKTIPNQLDKVCQVYLQGNLTTNRRKAHGVYSGFTG